MLVISHGMALDVSVSPKKKIQQTSNFNQTEKLFEYIDMFYDLLGNLRKRGFSHMDSTYMVSIVAVVEKVKHNTMQYKFTK